MKISDIPTKIPVAFAQNAGATYIRDLPQSSQIGVSDGAASWNDGFVPDNFKQIAAGGVPPYGKDMNGLGNALSKWHRWAQAGGVPMTFDAAFSTSVGGYPEGAFLRSTTLGNGQYWISTVDDNTTDPDSASAANWISFPHVLIQQQKQNYAVDSGIANQVIIALSPTPSSWASIVGAPIRVKIAATNTINNPTIKINALAPATIVNPDGSALAVGQLVVGGIMDGFPRDDGKFQVNSPQPTYTAPSFNWPIPGFMMPWPTETPPTGFLECNGATLLISSYPDLYNVLGTRYGGDGVNNFKLPDYRGTFLRGWDHGRGFDPDASLRLNAGGGITGDHVGTTQLSAAGHISITNAAVALTSIDTGKGPTYGLIGNEDGGDLNVNYSSGGGGVGVLYVITSFTATMNLTGDSGATETRPKNTYVMWVIAY